MSKLLKTALIIGYTFLFIQYLKITLEWKRDKVGLDYITHLSKNISKIRRPFEENNFMAVQFFSRPKRFNTDYKYILKYTKFLQIGSSKYKTGQTSFIEKKCKYNNCFLTYNINLLVDVRYYDAILFDLDDGLDSSFRIRHPDQKYVFVSSEPSSSLPVCDTTFNNYFNLTWTYKLDSDIPRPYFTIFDKQGNTVGPSKNTAWIRPMKSIPRKVKNILRNKNKGVAWIVVKCNDKSGRKNVSNAIEKELKKYGVNIDTFGYCGQRPCPDDEHRKCLELLQKNYYFYLALEYAINEDYVTERVLYPLLNYAVPIVYGGANYSRFLPPGSYIDASILTAGQVAAEINRAIKNRTVYENYFRWHNYYIFAENEKEPDMCQLCQILNEEAHKRSSYKNFVHWWNDKNRVCDGQDTRIF